LAVTSNGATVEALYTSQHAPCVDRRMVGHTGGFEAP
jgi:hypothetical protein